MKKLGLLILVVVMALGALGVGYANWSQDLEIGGSVTTGSLQIGVHNTDATDNAFGDTQVTSMDSVTARGSIGDEDFFAAVSESATNAYPGYSATCTIDIGNTGSVPVALNDVNLTGFTGDAEAILAAASFSGTIGETAFAGYDDMVTTLQAVTLDPGQKVTLVLTMTFGDGLDQNQSGTWTVTVTGNQNT